MIKSGICDALCEGLGSWPGWVSLLCPLYAQGIAQNCAARQEWLGNGAQWFFGLEMELNGSSIRALCSFLGLGGGKCASEQVNVWGGLWREAGSCRMTNQVTAPKRWCWLQPPPPAVLLFVLSLWESSLRMEEIAWKSHQPTSNSLLNCCSGL